MFGLHLGAISITEPEHIERITKWEQKIHTKIERNKGEEPGKDRLIGTEQLEPKV